MTTDEQRRVRVERQIRLEEMEEELRCYRLKATQMAETWTVLGQVGTGRMLGYRPEKEVSAYPSQAEVKTLMDKVFDLTDEIEKLRNLLRGGMIVVTRRPDYPPKD